MTDNTIADLMRRNLLEVFDEPDPERRNAVIARTYAEDVAWHEPDRVVLGRAALADGAAELRARNPDWVFQADGPVCVLDDLGHLAFHYGPAGQPPVVSGMDVAHCEGGVIVSLYTLITAVRPS